MRTLVILAALALSAPAWGQQVPCMVQDYSNPTKAPNWRCPGPDEGILVPDLKFNPSLGLEAGSQVTLKGAKKPIVLGYKTVVLDKDKVLQLGLRIQGLRRLRWLERHRATETTRIERKYMSDRITAQVKLEQSRVKVATSQRDQARKERDEARKWYRSWTCGLVVGIVVTTAAVIGTAHWMNVASFSRRVRACSMDWAP
jgi:hypothetical protein